ncbi:MAG: hypothetical protein GXP29_09260, partial [Planctomycetes bacterium]|nr:hypothetical protein [Planctomycetota bacterium]
FLSRYNYFHEFHHILAWGVVVGMIEGNFASVVVAKTFHGSGFLISIASAAPMAMHIFSLFWGSICVGRRKLRIFTLCTTGTVIALASVAMTPEGNWAGWLFVIQMAAAQFFQTGAVTVRSALWKSNYPPSERGQIAARLQVARAVTRMFSVAMAALVLDANPTSYRWIYPCVAVVGGVGVWCLQRLHVRGEASELRRIHSGAGRIASLTKPASVTRIVSTTHVLRSAVHVLKKDRRFRQYCIAQMFAGATNLLIRAVLVAIVTQRMLVGMDRAYWVSTVLLEVLPLLLMLATMHASARFYNRVGVVRFRVIQMLGWIVAILFGLFGTLAIEHLDDLGPRALLVAVGCFAGFAIVRGICLGGGSIAWNLGHLHFAERDDAEVYMGIHVSLTGLRAMVMPMAGMALWAWIGWWVWLVSVVLGIIATYCFMALERDDRSLALEANDRANSSVAIERT